ncbi:hypothetical protein ASPCAL15013 [Aspergillus calidoustus]|uniref:LysM domain-containing protein n=1 Tax=Aspergillus calidoustus TaxID=454130 RepID=A0A0U5GPI2_ASPCI|nr:hypothetical protein ASPCAL15013 [Aspergillus calidoustus]
MQLQHHLLAALSVAAAPSWALIQLFNSDTLPPLSPGCTAALSSNLSCGVMETGDTMYQLTVNLTTDMLDEMCSQECLNSIAAYEQKVEVECANDEFDDSGNSTRASASASGVYRPIVLPAYYLTNHKQRCLKDSDGGYCVLHLQATNDQDECDHCGLQMFQAELSNSYFFNNDLAEQFSSLTSSCSVSTLDTPTHTSVVLSSSSAGMPTPTACAERVATIQAGDTCDSFAAANNVSTWRMLIENGLQSGCLDFPTSGTLCVSGRCQTHLVQPQDTCVSLSRKYDITITQFITWNSVLNSLCSNFDVLVGHYVCVSYPGNATSEFNSYASGVAGSTATAPAPIPSDVVAGTNVNCGKYYHVKEGDYCQSIAMAHGITVSDFLFLNPEVDGNCTNLYKDYSYCVQPVGKIETYPGYGGSTTTPSPTVLYVTRMAWSDLPIATNLTSWVPIVTPVTAPLAKRTRRDCEEYEDNYDGAILCSWIARGVNFLDFISWNPSLDPYDCTLANNTRYCTLLGSGYLIQDTNPDESLLYADVPSNAAPDSTAKCYYWHETQDGDTCEKIMASANIALDAFYAWNPSVKSDCSNMWLNTSYCMEGPGYDDTYYTGSLTSTSTTLTGTGTATPTCTRDAISAPGPTQAGIACDCNKYTVQDTDGVYCQDLANQNDITLNQLYQWNPALNGDCSGLWLNYAYCIGVTSPTQSTASASATATTTTKPTTTTSASPTCATVTPPGPTQAGIPCTCDKYLMQADGIYCYDMAAESGITLDELYRLNPALGGDCSGLWAGYAYCVRTL